ncbi:Fe-S-containing hydro-lyase [Nitratifractor salsuginis]|jgi:fumarate hydratase subunit beta|uniref:Hydro-lyase, Fe-S type, tartrate/fumarate subfamily, beta subunit n=1 Tax=Nitratifractor salsuginis (strain DSM 16511 / JCM 12458 / E9I37-1) TaxID=749222 RepID=E6WZX0_NITSE|nr:Fe-S-containing hydro-lyase [Nitratifractor salsuginis]ADV45628.1 hydro-lyase, Fe-S type, tartrate/fumarate subfamily, beta subunit [Nitratifractor salsuginis DSM 16511]
MAEYHMTTPLTDEDVEKLEAGDIVYLNGTIYTARDAAHKRLVDLIEKGEQLPFDLKGSVIYFVGPTPPKPGEPIGSAGPTTSYRMDSYSPILIEHGQKGMIGKGKRNEAVKEACKKYKAVYFGATGGAGALIAKAIKKAEVIAYPELGPEAIRKLEVEEFPVTVINDTHGNDLYEMGRAKYEVKD